MKVNKQLYRDPEHARIAGVCAGIANFFGLERWLVRILFVTAFFLLAGPFMFIGYIAGWFILDKKPRGMEQQDMVTPFQRCTGKGWRNTVADENGERVAVKTKVWQAGEPPKQAFHDITSRFRDAELRLRKVEKYVTSREFQLNREISRL